MKASAKVCLNEHERSMETDTNEDQIKLIFVDFGHVTHDLLHEYRLQLLGHFGLVIGFPIFIFVGFC